MPIATLILAAGAGTRMGGVAKALLTLADGRTFLEAVVTDPARTIVVVAAPHAEAVRAEARRLHARVVVNPRPEDGMITSIRCGLAAATERSARGDDIDDVDAVLVHPVDHPLVPRATIDALRAAATADAVVLPGTPDHPGHPVVFGREVWPSLAAAATARDAVAAWPRVRHLGLVTAGDVDTPADYDRIKRQGPP